MGRYRKKTLRNMSPMARKVGRLVGEVDGISRKLKNLIPEIERIESDAKALVNAKVINKELQEAQQARGVERFQQAQDPELEEG